MDHRRPQVTTSVQFAAAAAAYWSFQELGTGGLAPIFVAVMAALLLGVPMTQWTWRQNDRSDHRARAMGRVSRVASAALIAGVFGVVAAACSPLLATAGLLGGLSLGRLRPAAGLPLAILATIAALVEASAPPWTLLEPVWQTAQSWLIPAVGTGLLLSGTGWGGFLGSDPRSPKVRGTVWRLVGLAGLLLLTTSWAWASGFEALAGEPSSYAPLAVGLLACATCGWTGTGAPAEGWDFVLLAGFCLLTGGPWAPDMPVYWAGVLLTPPAAIAAWMVLEHSSTARLGPAALLVAIGVAAWWGWPGFGASALGASLATLPVLAMAWAAAGILLEDELT